jgi:hypothetical protein
MKLKKSHLHTVRSGSVKASRRFIDTKGLVFIAMFAVVGLILLFAAHASTPSASLEAEEGVCTGAVSRVSDNNASGAAAVKFGTNGGCTVASGVGEDSSCIFASAPAGTTAAFCDGFNQPTVNPASSRSGDMNGLLWGLSRAAGDRGWQNYDTFDHTVLYEGTSTNQISNGGPLCGQTGIFAPPNDVKICNGQMQDGTTNVSGGDVTSIAMYPKQPFDFAGRTGTAVFDVSNDSEGGHDVWPEFWITDKPVPDPFQHQTSWVSIPKNALGIDFSATCGPEGGCQPSCQSNSIGRYPDSVGLAEMYTGYVKTDLPITYDPGHCVLEPPRPGTGQYMNHFEVRVSATQVDVYGTDAVQPSQMTATWIKANLKHMVTIPIPGTLPLTKGLIWIEDDRYNPTKAREDATHVYHRFIWDNVGFDGPKTYRDLAYDVPNAASPSGASYFNPNYVLDPGASTTLTVKNVDKGTADKGTACTDTVPCALLTLNYQTYTVRPPSIDFTLNGHSYHYLTPFNDTLDNQSGLDGNFSSSRTLAIPITIGDVTTGDNILKITNTTTDKEEYRNIDLIMVNAAPVP